MRLLALDMHVAITADVQNIFDALGHEVHVETLSQHAWVLGKSVAKVRGLHPPGRWSQFLHNDVLGIDQAMCDRFYRLNRKKFEAYDGFIVSYPPAFALLFERFDKPIIVISCTRFDFPCIDAARLEWLMSGLTRMNKSGKLIAIANNRLDQKLCEAYMPFGWRHIPSLCDYIGEVYSPTLNDVLLWFRGAAILETQFRTLRGVNKTFSIQQKYDRATIGSWRGVIHLPYQVSIMAAFEHYAQGIPMFVPSISYLESMYNNNEGVLTEVLFPNSSLDLPTAWLALADFYDHDNFAHQIEFGSKEELETAIADTNLVAVSAAMQEHHAFRQERVHGMWRDVLRGLK